MPGPLRVLHGWAGSWPDPAFGAGLSPLVATLRVPGRAFLPRLQNSSKSRYPRGRAALAVDGASRAATARSGAPRSPPLSQLANCDRVNRIGPLLCG